MTDSNNRSIADILKNCGAIDEETASMALKSADEQGTDILEILADNNRSRKELFHLVAENCGMVTVSLDAQHPPTEAAGLIPAEIALRYRVVPLQRNNNQTVLCYGYPTDLETQDTLHYLFKEPIEVMAALPDEIEQSLDRLYGIGSGSIPKSHPDTGAEEEITEPVASDADASLESDEPIIKLVNLLILEGFRQRASDIHLEPMARQFRVRYRVDGALREVEGPPRRLHPSVINRIKIMARMDIAEKRVPQDGRIEIRVQSRDLDLRVSSIPTNHGESIVMRILDKENLMLGLGNLGFFPDDEQRFEQMIRYPDGIVLVTGPTGSGKTTTLYSCLHYLNHPDRKIITAEDPVEYQLSGINQVHVRSDIGLTFAAALRSMLRQAPNIIMIGEIRDLETAEIAVNAALTGHLVLSTLHTNDAPGAVTRLIDIGIKPFLVSSSVRGIMAQRLVRSICADCRSDYLPTEAEQRILNSTATLYRGEGCPACSQTGYKGRKGLFELLTMSDRLRQQIYSGASITDLRRTARTGGMHTLREDGIRKAAAGITTLNEVLRTTMGDGN